AAAQGALLPDRQHGRPGRRDARCVPGRVRRRAGAGAAAWAARRAGERGDGNMIRLTCFACATAHDPGILQTVCRRCGMPLRVDMEPLRAPVMSGRPQSMWRYAEVLPGAGDPVTLNEGMTPLIEVAPRVWVKDEARNPTGSFKARGLSA